MKSIQWLKSGSIRKPDAEISEFHLHEELASPKVSIIGHHVAVWVYHGAGVVREIVICGHAESHTRARVSASVFEALKDLTAGAEWMISAGSGYVRLPAWPTESGARAFKKMLDKFSVIARLSGLVDVE